MQDEWGLTAFASREKQRRREREKKRRQRAMLAARQKQPAIVTRLPQLFDVFETSSGMKAVTVLMVNSWTTKPGEFPRKVPLSLPYVEFLHGPISGALSGAGT